MAFPTINGTPSTGQQPGNNTSWTVTYPTGVQAGELLLLLVASDGVPASLSATGFTQIFTNGVDNGANNTLGCLAKVADGSESGTFTLTNGSSEQGEWWIARIGGWANSGTLANDILKGTGTNAGSPGLNPNPPSLSIGSAVDALWFAITSIDGGAVTVSTYPTNYTDNQWTHASGGAGAGAGIGICTRNLNATSDDPGTFTLSGSDDYRTNTLAVLPLAAQQYTKAGSGVIGP